MKKDFVSLAEARPDLAKEWNYEKNGDLKPEDVSCGSNKKVWWKLPYDVPDDYPVEHLRGKHFDFEWEAKINNRVNKRGCPYLVGRAVWEGFNDLATIRPDLAIQWHPMKNGELKPTQVTANSGLKIWWLLPYDVPLDYPIKHLRGRHFEFEWEATIDSRNRIDSKGGCPYLSGRAVWEGFNDLQTVNPILASEWHPTKNGCLKPTQITANSDRKVWWLKTINNDIPGAVHIIEWQASISNRMSKKSGVPHKYKNIPTKGLNDFLTLYPEKAKQWDYNKNQGIKPSDVSANSTKVVWWKYDYFDESMKKNWTFTWKMSIVSYVKLTSVCPYVSGERLWPGFNDLKTRFPEIAKEWHPTKNGDFTPERCFSYSGKKVWWLYQYDVPIDYPIESLRGKHFDFEWQDIVQNRTKRNFKCPVLTGNMVWPGFNDLKTTHPEIARQWHPTKNEPLTPDKVTAGSNKNIIWIIQDIEPINGKKINLEWKAKISSRTYHDLGCPYVSGKAVKKGYNDFESLRPDLAKEWNYDKNGKLTPDMFTCGSHKKVWWIQYDVSPITNEIIKLEWESEIKNRVNGNGNPYKSGKAVLKGYNDLRTLRPDLAREWNYKKNGDLTPDMVTCGYDKKVWWLLPYDDPKTGKHFDFEWQSYIYSRTMNKSNCPYLSGQSVWKGFNDLQTINPKLALQWHPVKNGNLKPTDVTIGTNKRIWWILPYDDPKTEKHFDFEWQTTIARRNAGIGCPFLSGHAVWEGFNDLQTVNPKLASQWHPSKNGDLKPTQITAGSGKMVWWLFQYKDQRTEKVFNFEWQAVVSSRNQGVGCPYLITYKGEEYIKKYLQKNNISFDVQQKFSDLLGTGNGQLSYDFSIPDEKYGYILIEYNGIQHYEASEFFGGEEKFKIQKEHDKRKRDYAKKHGYKLITVKYTYDTYESIEEYLDKELKQLGVIDDTRKEENVNDAA